MKHSTIDTILAIFIIVVFLIIGISSIDLVKASFESILITHDGQEILAQTKELYPKAKW